MTADELTCEKLDELLDDFLAGILDATIVVFIDGHLLKCPHCDQQIALYRATICVARALPAEPEPMRPEFAERLLRMMLSDDDD